PDSLRAGSILTESAFALASGPAGAGRAFAAGGSGLSSLPLASGGAGERGLTNLPLSTGGIWIDTSSASGFGSFSRSNGSATAAASASTTAPTRRRRALRRSSSTAGSGASEREAMATGGSLGHALQASAAATVRNDPKTTILSASCAIPRAAAQASVGFGKQRIASPGMSALARRSASNDDEAPRGGGSVATSQRSTRFTIAAMTASMSLSDMMPNTPSVRG